MGAKIFCLCTAAALLGGCMKQPAAERQASSSRSDIEALFAGWAKAFEAKDVNGVMSIYASGAALTAYDIVPPLQFRGADAYRKDYADFFGQFSGPLHVEVPDMHIEVDGNIAYAYGLERLTGKLNDGTPIDMWLRYTEGLKL